MKKKRDYLFLLGGGGCGAWLTTTWLAWLT
jgi:hypothetical protein